MDDATAFVFVCGTCGESMEVNEAMREALLENGCVICGGSVTSDAFASR